ncbi:MAG TPA: hypothetical protein VKG45_09495 [Actinomycetes bacterium]|nr:hypothetical protein [Actinomycetes bacterium]
MAAVGVSVLLVAGVVTVLLVRGDRARVDEPRVEGDRYAFGLPAGWIDQPSARGLLSARGDTEALHVLSGSSDLRRLPRDGYAAVVRASGERIDLSRSVREFVAGARASGAEVRLQDPPRHVALAGADAIAFDFVITARGVRLRGRGVNAVHDGALYSLVLTVAEPAYASASAKFQHVTDTWRWR